MAGAGAVWTNRTQESEPRLPGQSLQTLIRVYMFYACPDGHSDTETKLIHSDFVDHLVAPVEIRCGDTTRRPFPRVGRRFWIDQK